MKKLSLILVVALLAMCFLASVALAEPTGPAETTAITTPNSGPWTFSVGGPLDCISVSTEMIVGADGASYRLCATRKVAELAPNDLMLVRGTAENPAQSFWTQIESGASWTIDNPSITGVNTRLDLYMGTFQEIWTPNYHVDQKLYVGRVSDGHYVGSVIRLTQNSDADIPGQLASNSSGWCVVYLDNGAVNARCNTSHTSLLGGTQRVLYAPNPVGNEKIVAMGLGTSGQAFHVAFAIESDSGTILRSCLFGVNLNDPNWLCTQIVGYAAGAETIKEATVHGDFVFFATFVHAEQDECAVRQGSHGSWITRPIGMADCRGAKVSVATVGQWWETVVAFNAPAEIGGIYVYNLNWVNQDTDWAYHFAGADGESPHDPGVSLSGGRLNIDFEFRDNGWRGWMDYPPAPIIYFPMINRRY